MGYSGVWGGKMKGFEKVLLMIFSVIIIALSVVLILTSTQMINLTDILKVISNWMIANKVACLVIGAVAALGGLIGLFASPDNGEDMKTGLAIKSEKGTVYITKDTFESIILSVARNFAELRNVRVELSVSEVGVIANIYTMILPDTVVPTLTAKLQESIKSAVLKQTTVEIKEANIKIKGVYMEPQKK